MTRARQIESPRGRLAVLVLAGCLGGGCGAPGGGGSDTGSPAGDRGGEVGAVGTFVSLSDLHFDPFYDPTLFGELMTTEATGWAAVFSGSSVTELAPPGADSNYNLLASALAAAAAVGRDADFVVISGDFLAHGFQDSFAKALAGLGAAGASPDCRSADRPALECFTDRTIEFVALMLRDRFADKPIYPALGNNDSYCGDYEVDPVGAFVRRTGSTWSRLLIDEGNRNAFDATFAQGGYYDAELPGSGGVRLLAMNTNLYSAKYRDACARTDVRERRPVEPGDPSAGDTRAAAAPGAEAGGGAEAARRQLDWLEDRLVAAETARESLLLLYHIPVGIDVYATLRHGSPSNAADVVGFWRPDHGAAFVDLVEARGAAIRGILAGHTHMDQYILLRRDDTAALAFEHVTPAISPLFGNNPGFELFTYARGSGELLDYATYYLPVAGGAAGAAPAWASEYRFSEAYGEADVSPQTLSELWAHLSVSGPQRAAFERAFSVGSGATSFDAQNRPAYWCGIGTLTAAEFAACVETASR